MYIYTYILHQLSTISFLLCNIIRIDIYYCCHFKEILLSGTYLTINNNALPILAANKKKIQQAEPREPHTCI